MHAMSSHILVVSALLPKPLGRSGGCRAFLELAGELVRRGHSVTYLTCYPSFLPVDPAALGGAIASIRVDGVDLVKIRVPFAWTLRRLAWAPRKGPLWWQRVVELGQSVGAAAFFFGFTLAAASAGMRLARRLGPFDLVYVHNEYGAWAGRYIAGRCDVPLVIRLLGTFLKDMMGQRFWRLRYPAAWQGMITPCDRLVITDDGTEGQGIARKLGVPAERVAFWRSGVRDDLYRPDICRRRLRHQLGLPDDRHVLLYLGRLGYHDNFKRTDRLIRLAAELRKRRSDFVLALAGPGRDLELLRQEASRLGVSESLYLAGGVSYEEVPLWYNAADLYVQLFDLSNWSNTLTEAMASHLPVVVRRDQSTRSVLSNGVEALLVGADNVGEQVQAVECVLDDSLLARRLGENAARWVAENCGTWTDRARLEVDLLESLVSRYQGPQRLSQELPRRLRSAGQTASPEISTRTETLVR
jgi:glycosyltransferase involved in cell wall biosynthesis